MRGATHIGVVFALLSAIPALAEELRLAVGDSAKIELPENLSTGYSWRVDYDSSEGLEILAILDRGHKHGASLPGAPGSHGWVITARKPGKATIAFVYQRPWEQTTGEARRFLIEVTR